MLAGTSWEIRSGEQWVVLGPNGSGKSSLVKALLGEVPVVRGRLTRHRPGCGRDGIGYVSFEAHEGVIAREEGRDDARHFSGDLDAQQTVGDLLGAPSGDSVSGPQTNGSRERLIGQLDIGHLLLRGVRALSTGEIRRVLIARALLENPWLLILDEPFDGLDHRSRRALRKVVARLVREGVQLILVTHRFEEIFDGCTHALCLRGGRVVAQGPRDAVLTQDRLRKLYARHSEPVAANLPVTAVSLPLRTASDIPRILVEMRDVRVSYGPHLVFEGLDWTMRAGENWAISGPNGSGKSTLLQLITGDHPQAYANHIRLFGRRRGSGETIWEIKQRIGVVSSELQVRYRKRLSVLQVVLSGFFDSVGLYRRADPGQVATARRWIERLGISQLANRPADQLSYGERRMALIARAMVKSPVILALDEPCQGLDRANRDLVLGLADRIGSQTDTRLIYITHHPDETPACITHVLRLGAAAAEPRNPIR